MKNALAFTFSIFTLIDELNKLSIKRTALDPLTDIVFKINMQFPEKDGIGVRITVNRTSGGAMESLNMINDSVSFIVKKKKIEEICFEQESSIERSEDLKMADEMTDAFVKRIKEFCIRYLPEATQAGNGSA